jgi:hypothetical protein
LVWSAQLPSASDAYVPEVRGQSGHLICNTWECYCCTIDASTGRILGRVLTK